MPFESNKGVAMPKTKMVLALLGLVMTLSAWADKDQFCSDRGVQRFGQLYLAQEANRLSFTNEGGIANGGVCWWHSRFTRNAAYVAHYRPELPRPSIQEAQRIIRAIRRGNALVNVPGYSDLHTFSIDFRQEIQKQLNQWQAEEGILNAGWIRGLQGRTSLPADKLATMMDELYQRVVVKHEPVYQKLQLPGIQSHAWIVIWMEKDAQGYILTVVDSNFLTLKTRRYTRGSTQMMYGNDGFVPYIEYTDELQRLENVVQAACRH